MNQATGLQEADQFRARAAVEAGSLQTDLKVEEIFNSNLMSISKIDKSKEFFYRDSRFNANILSSTPNSASLKSNTSESNNCFRSSSSLRNDKFHRRLLDSVSSDPEVYAKSSTTTKLNVQIQKLKNDMLALRSTTASYKVYMDKIFDELKAIAIMHDETLSKWHLESHDFRRKNPDHVMKNEESLKKDNETSIAKFDGDDFDKRELNKDGIRTLNTSSDFVSGIQYLKNCSPSSICEVNESTLDDVEDQNSPQGSFQQAQNSSARKLNKLTERPNSDPFATRSAVFPQNPNPNDSLAKKYLIKSADSSLETESKRIKEKSKPYRVFSILSKSDIVTNISNKNLRISECSIDSGYQGSSVTSPRDKLLRESGCQAITPLHETSAVIAGDDQTSKQAESRNVLAKPSESPAVSPIEPQRGGLKESAVPDIETMVDGKPNHHRVLVPTTKITNKNLENTTVGLCSEQNNPASLINKKPDRPVPKQRTVFAILQAVSATEANNSLENCEANGSGVKKGEKFLDQDFFSNNSVKTLVNSSTNENKKSSLNGSSCDKLPLIQPKRPQRLAVAQPDSHAPIDLGSPNQRRVKLGVSAIKQLTPNSEKKEGSLFYCVGQVSRGNDVNSRARKTVNTKQILREKYAAAIERSSRAAAKKELDGTHCESDWSMVRRRSMRMMTEFQIFDFKDTAEGEKSTPIVRRKAIVVGETTKAQSKPGFLSCNAKPDTVDESACKNYSVSPSAAVVSKQIFEVESRPKENSRHSKSSLQMVRKFKKNSDNPPQYAGHPLPPPPPSPPKTPPALEKESVFKISPSDSSNIPAELIENPAFGTPVVRPKASIPPDLNLDATKPQQPCYNGLKLSPNSRSAFSPVASVNVTTADGQTTSSGDLNSTISSQDNDLQNTNKTQTNKTEKKRRQSLPQALLSNKQRFLNEFMPNASFYDTKEAATETDPTSELQQHASLCAFQNNAQPIDSVISTETSTVTSYRVPENSIENDLSTFATTEPLFCKIPEDASSDTRRDTKHLRHASGDKVRTSSSTSSNQRANLEHQPVRFNRSERITDVVGALQTAGYLPSNELLQTGNKASHPNTITPSSNNKLSKEDNNAAAPVQFRGRQHFLVHPEGQMQACYKARSSSSLHQYETVKLIDNGKGDYKDKNKRIASKDVPPDDSARNSAPRSHKSTIALIRDSLLGKRDKPRSATADSKRNQAVNAGKVRSSSVGDKLKISESSFFESKFNIGRKKESKSKKEKIDLKATKKENVSNKDKTKIQGASQTVTPSEETFVFPDPNQVVYGSPDGEVLERFLAAAAAAASDTPRSPLQRLRSSFRTPKNKNKTLQESRVRDDIDVDSASYSRDCKVRKNTNVHNGQEFTYV